MDLRKPPRFHPPPSSSNNVNSKYQTGQAFETGNELSRNNIYFTNPSRTKETGGKDEQEDDEDQDGFFSEWVNDLSPESESSSPDSGEAGDDVAPTAEDDDMIEIIDTSEKLDQVHPWERFTILPGNGSGFGRPAVLWDEVERQRLLLQLQEGQKRQSEQRRQRQQEQLKQMDMQRQQPHSFRNIQMTNSMNRGHLEESMTEPRNQLQMKNQVIAAEPRRQHPDQLQRIMVNNFVLRPPIRPSSPSIVFNGKSSNLAVDRSELRNNNMTLVLSNISAMAEMYQMDEQYRELLHLEPENFEVLQLLRKTFRGKIDFEDYRSDPLGLCQTSLEMLELNPQGAEEKGAVRRHHVLGKMIGELRLRNSDYKKLGDSDEYRKQVEHRANINFYTLAINNTRPVKRRPDPGASEDYGGCTFCHYDCDYGIRDPDVLLAPGCSSGFCTNCIDHMTPFNSAWEDAVQGRNRRTSIMVTRERMNERMRLGKKISPSLRELTEEESSMENRARNEAVATQSNHSEDSYRTGFDSEIVQRMTAPDQLARRFSFQVMGGHDQVHDPQYGSQPSNYQRRSANGPRTGMRPEHYQQHDGSRSSNSPHIGMQSVHHQPHDSQQNNGISTEKLSKQHHDYLHQMIYGGNGGFTPIQNPDQNQSSMNPAGRNHSMSQSPMIGVGSDFTPQELVRHTQNTNRHDSSYGPPNLRGGGLESASQESGDEDADVPPNMNPEVERLIYGDSNLSSGFVGSERLWSDQPTAPTAYAGKQHLPSIDDGKSLSSSKSNNRGERGHPLRQPSIKYDTDSGEEDESWSSDEDKSESQVQSSRQQTSGLGESSQATTSKKAAERRVASTPKNSRNRAGSSVTADSYATALLSPKSGSRSNVSPTPNGPTLKRKAPSSAVSSESPRKKPRRQRVGRVRSLTEELAINPNYRVPPPPISSGLTLHQIKKVMKEAKAAALSVGYSEPMNIDDVEAQGLVPIPSLTTSRLHKFQEATAKYRAYYGNRYEEQQSQLRSDGDQNRNAGTQQTADDMQQAIYTSSVGAFSGNFDPRQVSGTMSLNGRSISGNSLSGSREDNFSRSPLGGFPESERTMATPMRPRSAVAPSDFQGRPFATNQISHEQQYLWPPQPAASDYSKSPAPAPRRPGFAISGRDPASQMHFSPVAGRERGIPSISNGQHYDHDMMSAGSYGAPPAMNQLQMSPHRNMPGSRMTSASPRAEGGMLPLGNHHEHSAMNQLQSSPHDMSSQQPRPLRVLHQAADPGVSWHEPTLQFESPGRNPDPRQLDFSTAPRQNAQAYHIDNRGPYHNAHPQSPVHRNVANPGRSEQEVMRSGTQHSAPLSFSRPPTALESAPVITSNRQDRVSPQGPPAQRPPNNSSHQPQAAARPVIQSNSGSQMPTFRSRNDARHRQQGPSNSAAYSPQSNTQPETSQRTQVPAQPAYTPRKSSGLRHSQLSSPLASPQLPQFPHPPQHHQRDRVPQHNRLPQSTHNFELPQNPRPHTSLPQPPQNSQPPQNPPPSHSSTHADNTDLDGILFCSGCPWTQVDIKKARMCDLCKTKKLIIIMHLHFRFVEMSGLDREDNGYFGEDYDAALFQGRKLRACMICPGHAIWVCSDCPLRLCANCKVHMVKRCEGKVENLLKYYGKTHVRNDAFLLRSDGGGY